MILQNIITQCALITRNMVIYSWTFIWVTCINYFLSSFATCYFCFSICLVFPETWKSGV